jgi:hypothetical protein
MRGCAFSFDLSLGSPHQPAARGIEGCRTHSGRVKSASVNFFHTHVACGIVLAAVSQSRAPEGPPPLTAVEAFSLAAGTQTIGAGYQFTKEPMLVETARAMLAMGSNIAKFSMEGKSPYKSLAERAERDRDVQTVLHLPFAHYFLWASPLSAPYGDGTAFDPARLESQRREIYDLTSYLLEAFNGSGKTFYLGNWEGDWLLTGVDPKKVPDERTVQNMIAWGKTRQQAVDDARRDTPHQNVAVYHYIEVNRVRDAKEGKVRVTNKVLPETNPDFVSYSAYDAQGPQVEKALPELLDYIQSQLKPKPGLPEKRVFIGEYGLPATRKDSGGPAAQDLVVRRVLRTALRWECPFVLYWQMYDNEKAGFWLIDNKNAKQPAYFTHASFLTSAKAYVAEFHAKHHRLPTRSEFGAAALEWLHEPPAPRHEDRAIH